MSVSSYEWEALKIPFWGIDEGIAREHGKTIAQMLSLWSFEEVLLEV